MDLSMRGLFGRRQIRDEVISLKNSLANHVDGLEMGLRAAHARFTTPADGNGFRRGCQRRFRESLNVLNIVLDPVASTSDTKDLAFVIPEWVSVDDRETRTVEGILVKSKITHKDFPPRPWHTYYDWNLFVRVDPQYQYLLAPYNLVHEGGVMECEWDTGVFPGLEQQKEGTAIFLWPQIGDRVWMVGRWIYDCGHPCEQQKEHPGDSTFHGHVTEIHPPKALAIFRPGAARFPDNRGLTRATNAVLYIGRDGGYFRQPINDQDYAFDLYLPPRPHDAAVPRFHVRPLPGHALPVEPRITAYPDPNPRALRVVVPLKGHEPHPENYAAIITGGWSDPAGNESSRIRSLRVTVESIAVTTFHEGESKDEEIEEWQVYIGVNGVWHVRRLDVRLGETRPLNVTVDLDLHVEDGVHVSACGFEEDTLHSLIGRDSGFTWEQISDPRLTEKERAEIMEQIIEEAMDKNFLGIPGRKLQNENDPLGLFSRVDLVGDVPSGGKSVNGAPSDKGDYKLSYTIRPR